MGQLKWGGKTFYPQAPKPFKSDVNELMKPLSEKVDKGNVWGSIIMNVPEETSVGPVSPTPTPSVTPTITPSASLTPTPSVTPSITPSITPSVTATLTPTPTPSPVIVYPLDTVTGATYGFSMDRKLTSSATKAFRIRRSSDDTELDIGFDGFGNVDSTAISNFAPSGNSYVVRVYNQVGAMDMVQSTGLNQPYISTGGTVVTLNGNLAFYADSANPMGMPISTSALTLTSDIGILAVIKAETAGSGSVGMLNYDSNPTNDPELRLSVYSAPDFKALIYSDGSYRINENNSGGTYSLQSVYFEDLGTTQGFTGKTDGDVYETGSYTGQFSSGVNSFGIAQYLGGYRSGYFSELIMYNKNVIGSSAFLENNIMTHYGI